MSKKEIRKKVVKVYDAKGEVCPYPAMYAKAILQDMNPGEILEVEVDHLCAVEGIPAAVKMLGHRVLKTENLDHGIYRITVEVMGSKASSDKET